MTFDEALNDALLVEMRRDSSVVVIGEDVELKQAALFKEFGARRVRNTPISEAQIIGLAVGSAAMGLRPVTCMSFSDFLCCCFDEIVNQAAKMSYMLGGQTHLPLVVRCSTGAGIRAAAQHSQSLESVFAQFPGLKVAVPSTPEKAKGLLAQAIRDDNPVIFFEHKLLGRMEGEVPAGEYTLPFGRADVVREGDGVTLVAWGRMVPICLDAAARLSAQGTEAEVIDVMTLTPFDEETVLASVRKTGRCVVAHEAVLHGGFGGEVAARVAEKAFASLKGPVKRVGAPFSPVPFSPPLEDAWIPGADCVVEAIQELL
jgi:pyruvate dehydrogenase E1 component beta subunit